MALKFNSVRAKYHLAHVKISGGSTP